MKIHISPIKMRNKKTDFNLNPNTKSTKNIEGDKDQ